MSGDSVSGRAGAGRDLSCGAGVDGALECKAENVEILCRKRRLFVLRLSLPLLI